MPTEQQLIERERGAAVRRLDRNLTATVDRLKSLVENVEREGRQALASGRYSEVASNVVHEVTWGVANLNLSALMDAARLAAEVQVRSEKDGEGR